MLMRLWILFFLATNTLFAQQKVGNYKCDNGTLMFRSDAPLETIVAKTTKLRGLVNPGDLTFAWVMKVTSFEGFNSGLQQDHFKENYLETEKYPTAVFQGKIIEDVDLSKAQKITVRAKGKLTIHGVEQERIIKVTLDVKDGQILIKSTFTVALEDHNINIPRIVNQKIAEEVEVTVTAKLEPEKG